MVHCSLLHLLTSNPRFKQGEARLSLSAVHLPVQSQYTCTLISEVLTGAPIENNFIITVLMNTSSCVYCYGLPIISKVLLVTSFFPNLFSEVWHSFVIELDFFFCQSLHSILGYSNFLNYIFKFVYFMVYSLFYEVVWDWQKHSIMYLLQ